MFELSLLFAFLLVKYAIPEATASITGQPTARARDKALREEVASRAAHHARLANLPPPPPPVWEAIKARLATWIAPRQQPKPAKAPKQRGPWRRAWDALVKEAGEEAERRVTRRRFDRSNRRRRRAGQRPIIIDVYPCLGCAGKNVVDHPTRLCPACTRAAAASQPAPTGPASKSDSVKSDSGKSDSPRPATCAGTRPCAACYQGDWCIRNAWDDPPANTPPVPGHDVPGDDASTPPTGAPPMPPPPSSRTGSHVGSWYDPIPGLDEQPATNGDETATDPHGMPPVPHPVWCRRCAATAVTREGDLCAPCAADDQAEQWPDDPTEPAPGPDPETPAPTGAGNTTPGGNPMSQSLINPDINDPTGARRFTASKTATLRDVAEQYERMIAAARGGKLGDAAIGELVGIQVALLRVAGTVEQATSEFDKDVALQREIGADDDLKGTVAGTYTDINRAS